MSDPVQLSSIPTIADLYKNGQLQPAPPTASLPAPFSLCNSKISLIRGSITKLATTSIINAANNSLLGGGGVDGAIHSAAGPSLYDECLTLNGCNTGSAKITSAHALPSKYIIHAVGPIYHRARSESPDRPAELLRSCYRTSLDLAAEKGGSVAFSCLSTGVYGYPKGEAAQVALTEVRRWLEEEEGAQRVGSGRLERVVFCLFDTKDEEAYHEWVPKIFPPTPDELPPEEQAPKDTATTEQSTKDTATTEQAPITDTDTTATTEPSAEKLKSEAEDIDKDWEPVEKPSETASEKTTDISEEGEKVEAPDLGGSDGEKVEKPETKDVVEEAAATGKVLPQSNLEKDW